MIKRESELQRNLSKKEEKLRDNEISTKIDALGRQEDEDIGPAAATEDVTNSTIGGATLGASLNVR